ncbi:MAG: CHRD domain-containing protein [Acidobacteriota bacterium]
MRNRFLSLSIAVFFIVSLSSATRAETFTAYLSGAQEVPPVATSATGYARIFVNESTMTMTFTVVFNNLGSTQTGAHIHAPAAIGVNAGVAIALGTVGGTSGTITGSTSITPTQLAQIRQHLGYVNVHSMNFPGGEIRGQLGISRVVDYDGDGRTDYSVLRFPSVAPPGVSDISWWNLNSTVGPQLAGTFGDANRDFPTPGDYDGDGKGDLAFYRRGATAVDQSSFYIVRSSDSTLRYFAWGLGTDDAIPRDYDGDGITDVAVFRPGATAISQTIWYIRNSATQTARVEAFGLTGNGTSSFDSPVPGDYDGDGKFDLAVYRFGQSPGNHYIIKRSSDSVVTYEQLGNFQTDYIVPGDYDGDGKYDLAVARTGALGTSPLVWWVRNSSTGNLVALPWGRSSDFPTQGDYDGDGRTDIAIYRAGAGTAQSFFWVRNSFDFSAGIIPWGIGSDFAVNRFDTR